MKICSALKKVAEKAFIAFSIIFAVVFFYIVFSTGHVGWGLLLLALLIYNALKWNH